MTPPQKARPADLRREALRERLIELAQERIEAGGTAAVKARELAQAAGCSVGSIYNVLPDLSELIIAVNGRSFTRLDAALARASSGVNEPRAQLLALALGYLDWAADNRALWQALFSLEGQDGPLRPQWYQEALAVLFARIETPLGRLMPQQSPAQITLLARTLFAAVHGIVQLGLNSTPVTQEGSNTRAMIELLLGQTLDHHATG